MNGTEQGGASETPDEVRRGRTSLVGRVVYFVILISAAVAALVPSEGEQSSHAPDEGETAVEAPETPVAVTPNKPPEEKLYKWGTGYTCPQARGQIHAEAAYLAVCFVLSSAGLLAIWLIQHTVDDVFGGLPMAAVHSLCIHSLAFLAGMLGGTLFSYTWLRESVRRGLWKQDFLLWRISQPLLAGSLGLITVCLVESDLFKILDSKAITKPSVAVGIGFLAGYFSDSALVKFREIAVTMFGPDKESKDKKSE